MIFFRHPVSLRRATAWPCVIALAIALPSSAHAQSAADSARAEKIFAEASALVDRGDFAAACPKLEESQRLDPALGTQFNLALCYEKIGKLGRAWRNFRGAERLARATGKKGREEAARQRLDAIRVRAPHFVIATPDSDATVKVDGDVVERGDFAFYPVDPGQHTVDVTAPAKKPWQTQIVVPANGAGPIKVDVPALPEATGRVVTVTKETSNTRRTLGFVFGGVGVVGLGVGVATGLMILDARATAEEKDCKHGCLDEEGNNAVSRGKTLLPINYAAFGVAAAGLGVGTYLLLTSSPKASAPSARVVPFVSGDVAGVGAVGRF